MKKKFTVSVRELVEFIFREGDIDNRKGGIRNADAMMAGSRLHAKIQKAMGTEYMAEVPLKYSYETEEFLLVVDGRADGIFRDEIVWIDEIKGMYRKVEKIKEAEYVHRAQAMCYAYIFALENELSEIGIQLTYVNIESENKKYFKEVYSFEEIKDWFMELIHEYEKWLIFQSRWFDTRQQSISNLKFPFDYRPGQKKLVEGVYRTILREKNLFIQAPTGTGKTLSTVYPAVMAMGQELIDRIFYLTAKTITRSVAWDSFMLLKEQGFKAKVIMITAKEKICLCEEMDCNPVNCPYAKGHFDRVNDAVFELINKEDNISRELIIEQAKKHRVCPFELSLDLSSFCDSIICDYNYVFDPCVKLKRFFGDGKKGKYLYLVDEAHNLVERAREMYSATLFKEDILAVRRILKPISKKCDRQLDKANKIMLGLKRECDNYEIYEELGSLYYVLLRLNDAMNELLSSNIEIPDKKTVLDFYFELKSFVDIYSLVDEKYVVYSQFYEEGRFGIKLFNVDPSENLQECIDLSVSTIFFSATFLPISYYKRLLSTVEDNYAIYADSVFDSKKRLLIFGKDVSTKYSRRNEEEYIKIAEYIKAMVLEKTGNYLVFLPSYKLMEDIAKSFEDLLVRENYKNETISILLQSRGMDEEEREIFLREFDKKRDESLVGFAVMGGIFGEGIDLKGESLIGAAIVGTGLPMVSNEREILKNYYDSCGLDGFDYAFKYPGMNKVLQSAGRVIRTSEDRGVIMLLDDRFLGYDYSGLYPREWDDRIIVDVKACRQEISNFWKEMK